MTSYKNYRFCRQWKRKSLSWCITWYYKNTKDVCTLIRDHHREWFDFSGQIERGAMGHLHFQCVILWKKEVTFDYVRKLFHNSHVEATINFAAAWRYCAKEKTRAGAMFWMMGGEIYCSLHKIEKFLRTTLRDDGTYVDFI